MTAPDTKGRCAEILLVEDNPVDVLVIKQAFQGKSCNLNVAEDGEEAMHFLYKRGKYSSAPSPDLVLLDLNMPRKDGSGVLAEIKEDLSLRHIPVIVLTTSQEQEDIWKSYELQANCFITKTVDLEKFIRALECLEKFWFNVVTLPVSPRHQEDTKIS
jgi:chemotaxis family two-component system response regulator Rcp1